MIQVVRNDDREVLGYVERTNHGCYFADAWSLTGSIVSLGVFTTKTAARHAVFSWHEGRTPVGRISPTILYGPRPAGQAVRSDDGE